jgi:5-methylcytosine-specific restriction endonuclease McrA
MTAARISKALRERVSAQARYRCGYCLTAEAIVGTPMEIDHVIPRALGGPTVEDNLWLACSLCNDHKSDQIAAADPLTGEIVPLFHPRRDVWDTHFAWTGDGERIVGLTPVGRATVVALHLNRPSLVTTRQNWVSAGWHPPRD